jgi:hypothetical protein
MAIRISTAPAALFLAVGIGLARVPSPHWAGAGLDDGSRPSGAAGSFVEEASAALAPAVEAPVGPTGPSRHARRVPVTTDGTGPVHPPTARAAVRRALRDAEAARTVSSDAGIRVGAGRSAWATATPPPARLPR